MTFTEEEVKHYFMPRENVMHTFVASRIEATVSGKKKEVITDLISYYDLPIQVFSHPKHSSIRVHNGPHRLAIRSTAWPPQSPTRN